jgi:NTP pyrophosphatase (non-canonical NTP hydrolase)
MVMNDKDKEILLIAAEECAEITQAISKILRFGLHVEWQGKINSHHLATEIGDLICMIDLMCENGLINRDIINEASVRKTERLKVWSSIFD